MKRIVIWNKKGGVGKTILSYSLAKDLDYYYITNDDSIIPEIYEDKAAFDDNLPLIEANTIYDLGGFVEDNVSNVIKHADLVVIPTYTDINSIKRTYNLIEEIKENYPEREIMVIFNRLKKTTTKKYEEHQEIIKGLDVMTFPLRESEIFPNVLETNSSIKELYEKNNLTKSIYKGVFAEYNVILKYLGSK
jgi:cellulose biosynthesis protein BcsQ